MMIKIIVIIIVFILFIHYKNYNKYNKNIEIIQLNIFNKKEYEKILNLKQPIILYDFLSYTDSFNELSFDSLRDINNMKIILNDKTEIELKDYIEKIEKEDIEKEYYENNDILSYIDLPLDKELNLLISPLSIYKSKNFTITYKNYISPLVYTNFDKNIFLNYEGLLEFYIYNKSDISNLYFEKKNKIYYISKINNILEKEENEINYPNIKNTNYITIRLYKGQVLILPNYIPYCYKSIEPSLLINSKSETIFSFLFNLKNI